MVALPVKVSAPTSDAAMDAVRSAQPDAVVVIGGMRSMLGPAIGALFFILFRELFSIWTANWLLWFGLRVQAGSGQSRSTAATARSRRSGSCST